MSQQKPGLTEVIESIAPLKIKCVGIATIILFWVAGTWAFVAQRLGIYDAINTPMQLLIDAVFILLGVWTIRNKWDISVLVSYLIISFIITVIINKLSLIFWINGSRFYFNLIFILPIYRWIFEKRERSVWFMHYFDRSLYIFLWIQLPCILFQLVKLGGNDQGGGSFGNLMSGPISCIIYVISYYLMLRRWDYDKSYVKNLIKNWDLIFLLCPSFMNETKISFIFLLVYFLLLVPLNKKFIRNMLITLPFAVLLLWGALSIYVRTTNVTNEMLSLEWLEYYVMGDDETYEIMESVLDRGTADDSRDYMRGAKFLMLPAVMLDKPWGPWVGYGVSQYKGMSVLDMTDFYRRYEWFFYGTTTLLMQTVVDMGLVGVIWMLYAFCVMLGWFGGKRRNFNRQLQLFLVIQLLMMLLYAASLYLPHFSIPFIYVMAISWNWDKTKASTLWEKERRLEHEDEAEAAVAAG